MITKTFKDENELAKFLALEILRTLKRKKKLVLGCPGGRSLKKTYYFLGILSHTLKISLNNLIIVMMDEYVYKKNDKFVLENPNNHNSCVRFSKNVIKKLLNYKKNKVNALQSQNIFFPSINEPSNYDKLIKKIETNIDKILSLIHI